MISFNLARALNNALAGQIPTITPKQIEQITTAPSKIVDRNFKSLTAS
jgi:hypothetical protein